MIKSVILLFSVFLSFAVFGRTTIVQSEQLSGGETNKNGNAIQIAFNFDKPIQPNNFFEVYVGDKKAIDVTNLTDKTINKFITRLRLNQGEKIGLRVQGWGGAIITYSPEVSSNYVPPNKDEFNLRLRASVVNEQIAKSYGAAIGDCVYLFSGVSNSGQKTPKIISLKSNFGEVKVESTERISSSPFFLVGLSGEANSCTGGIETDSPIANSPSKSNQLSSKEAMPNKVNEASQDSQGSLVEAKIKCLDLGFKDKTEAFGKCVLRITK